MDSMDQKQFPLFLLNLEVLINNQINNPRQQPVPVHDGAFETQSEGISEGCYGAGLESLVFPVSPSGIWSIIKSQWRKREQDRRGT